ncbi:MAG: hypothetical protein HKO53_15015, partial [Gemmatimonadetes bacterium]|nr:hypothetical protein [Gemmatimonadota bacterium]
MLVRSFFLFVLVAGLALATAAEAQPVTLPQIMQHPDWIGRAPEDGYWSDDSSEIIYSRKREGSEVRDRFVVDRRGRTTVEVSPDRIPELSVDGGDVSRDGRRKVYAREGDLYLKDVRSGRIEQLTRTQDRERSPRFLRGDEAIQFRRGDALLVRDLKTGLEWQPADLRTEDDPDEETEDEPSYLEQQQKDLFGIVRLWEKNEQDREAHDDLLRAQDPYRAPEPWYLGSKKEIRGTTFSPNGRWLLVRLVPAKADRGQRDVMPNYVSDDGYVTTEEVRPKVGTGDVLGEEFVLLDLTGRMQYELDLGSLPDITVDRLADIRARTQAWRAERMGSSDDADEKADDEKEKKEEDPKPRAVSMFGSEWHADGDQILLQLFSEDNKDRWIVRVDAPTQTVHAEHHLHDPAWINWRYNEFGWIPRSDRLFYLSEETGYSRLYVKEAGGDATAWTDDGATVAGVESDREGKWLYFRSNRPHPGVYEIYRASTRNGNVEQVTNLGGVNQATLSPDGKRLLVRHSEIDRHEELIVVEAKSGGRATPVTDTVSAAFAAQDWVIPQIVEVPGSHGRPIYSKFYPPAAGTPPGGPAVIFVHGAGYTQNAHFGWAYYFREFMFHTLLSQHGYAV